MGAVALPLARYRTQQEIERVALGFLAECAPERLVSPGILPVGDILEWFLWERYGVPFFLSANLPPDVEAVTRPARGYQPTLIEMQPYVYENLQKGYGRPKFTAAHEIGHALLHAEEIAIDLVNGRAPGLHRASSIPYGRNPERQANIFAGHLLMPRAMVMAVINSSTRPRAQAVADAFGVTSSAAESQLREIGLG